MNLKNIATIAGKSGLFKIIKPTRNGVVIESLDAAKTRTIASASNKVSILHEITMYTNTAEGTIPLRDVLVAIKEKYGDTIAVDSKSEGAALHSFMGSVVPEYDTEKVYTSDLKKLVTWYSILAKFAPETFNADEAAENTSEEQTETAAG